MDNIRPLSPQADAPYTRKLSAGVNNIIKTYTQVQVYPEQHAVNSHKAIGNGEKSTALVINVIALSILFIKL